jgi:signal transduction histidine kinase/DNA-binding response OmpR family regulator
MEKALNAEKANILVVDDLPGKLLVIESILAELDQNLVAVTSGEEALRRVLEQEFAVILLDVNMPGMDGFETAELIRRRRKSAHTPIIFITAFADEIHTARGYALGAVDYILSPIVPTVLRTKVGVFVELFQMAQAVRRQAEERVTLAREQAARLAAEEATRRSAFLAEASKVLAGSLDYEATVNALPRLVVPYLADVGGVTLADDGDGTRLFETERPCGVEGQASVLPTETLLPAWADALRRTLRSGGTQYLADVAEPESAAANGQKIKIRSLIVVPLLTRARALGALSFGMGHSGRRYTAADVVLAEDLAGRAAVAVDNAALYRDLQQADQKKNEFLSMLAHELRNPLAPIRNAVHILGACGDEPPELRVARAMIDRQAQHLVRLVDDLLDVSRITLGKIRLEVEPVDIGTVVGRAVEISRPVIAARKHELTVVLPPEPLRVDADPVRLAQVLGNLLDNAAKYTPEGGQITLTAAAEADEVVIRVRDNGVGIPAGMLSSVFELFTQVERSLDRSQGGLGIGLTLVRRLVEMHHGRVDVISGGPGAGSEFVVRLPASAARPAAAALNGAQNPLETQRPCRVLVVDDHIDAGDSLTMLLRLAGHQVNVCRDGMAALAVVDTVQPDVVLLDLGLPGMDGYEVARRLRSREDGGRFLLVALTGYGRDEDIRRSQQVGFDHHLVKPADLGALNAIIHDAHGSVTHACLPHRA